MTLEFDMNVSNKQAMAVHRPAQAKAGHAGHNRPNQPYFDPFDMKV